MRTTLTSRVSAFRETPAKLAMTSAIKTCLTGLLIFGAVSAVLASEDQERTILVSVGNSGFFGGSNPGTLPEMSSDGMLILYPSAVDDGIFSDVNNISLRNATTNTSSTICSGCSGGHMSRDARFVLFSTGRPLAVGDTNDQADAYLLDRETGAVEIVYPGLFGSASAAISAEGDWLVIQARPVGSSVYEMILIERATNARTFLGRGDGPVVSAHGKIVAWADGSGIESYDRTTGVISIESRSLSGVAGNGQSYGPALSDDGSVLAFVSSSNNLVPGTGAVPLGPTRVFVRDRTTDRIVVAAGAIVQSGPVSISADGRFVAFRESGDYIRSFDTVLNTTETMSAWSDETLAPAAWGIISADARFLTFLARDPSLPPDAFPVGTDTFRRRTCYGGMSLSSISMTVPPEGGTNSIVVTVDGTSVRCARLATTQTPWIRLISGNGQLGSGAVTIDVDPNPSSVARTGMIVIARQIVSITQAAGPFCGYAVSPSAISVIASGGNSSVSVTTAPGCAWTAVSNSPWATIYSGASGSGSGSVALSIAANSTLSPRVATLTIAGHTVTLTQGAEAEMAVDRSALTFGAVSSGVAFVSSTAPQTVRLVQSGSGSVFWTAVSSSPWVVVTPSSGTGTSIFNVSVQFAAGLPAVANASISIILSGSRNAINPITVRLNVTPQGNSAPPVGSFDTPMDGTSGVTGSLGVTGWAMDDVQVTRVRIERDPVAGEPAGATVFIGNASFVDGARPDVGAAFPTSPMNTRAGWGYLMLTNFLPGLGNGTFKLYAIAEDADGHSTILGTKTITCANATATNPFGAIDTPGQGAIVSGVVNNFGWVLAPGARKADPLHGGTVVVIIDGAVVGSPDGWVSRTDLTSLFPVAQFSGIANALAVYTFDSSTLTNGVHTIAWAVTDNLGGVAGIGSRYFTVSNGAGLQLAPAGALRVSAAPGQPLKGRRGPDLDAPFEPLNQTADGVFAFAAEELDRIELRVTATSGHLRSAMGDLPLPVGSRLDPSDDTFTWQVGPGFIGAYDLVFDTPTGTETVRVSIYPQGMLSRPQVIIDTPSADEELSGSFTIAGWAVDPRAQLGTGIDAIHVWAYPSRGRMPIFLSAATLTGERPDVEAIYGVRATRSGYGINIDGLPPGSYDIAVFAWSVVEGRFLPARTRRVLVR